MAKKAVKKPARKTARKTAKKPAPGSPGWLSTDAEELERRRERGAAERFRIETLEPEQPLFGTFRVRSGDADAGYTVEIRSLCERINLCDCPDHRVNGLGTCKHVEAVLLKLSRPAGRRRDAAERGSPRVEVFLDRDTDRVCVRWPRRLTARAAARALLAPFFAGDGTLLADPLDGLPALRRALAEAPARVRERVRVSRLLDPWLRERRRRRDKRLARDAFLADVEQGKRSLDVLARPLYPYQHQGMLHLAFTERALLADEMGLGKTVQAIAACELLRRLRDIARVLVIAPASLKTEWQEQIAAFTELPVQLIYGGRAARREQYRRPGFFYLCNYEQVLNDGVEMRDVLAPDVIILDEAQRIKNWQTKTAAAVKKLTSRYAFVLTGTPLENRIDEVYSIVQFLDPAVFGPLFRFNRTFYQLDGQGRPLGYKNLDELNRRLQPIMLRRRKREVEGQLPARRDKHYYVPMHAEQLARYDEHAAGVARLMQTARRRALLPKDMQRLQKHLACMRMLCDTPYILDRECAVSPKLDELARVLPELLEESATKVVVFSEWARMLELVAGLAERLGVGYAQHNGALTQPRRRAEIDRFKTDPDCRLLLSTDAGSTGLNLQVASVIVNLDLPWNPARLEQRVARVWRKHQTRAVRVLSFICEDSIEQRMLLTLDRKQALADTVIDTGEVAEMTLPSGRRAMIERIEALTGGVASAAAGAPAETNGAAGEPSTTADEAPLARFGQDALARLSDRLQRLQIHRDGGSVLAVLDRADADAVGLLQRAAARHAPDARIEVLDRATYATLQRLAEAGIIHFDTAAEVLRGAPPHAGAERRRLEIARRRFADAERRRRMAGVLHAGGFTGEALRPLADAVEQGLTALAYALGDSDLVDAVPLSESVLRDRLLPRRLLPDDVPARLARLRRVAGAEPGADEETAAAPLYDDAAALCEQIAAALARVGSGR